jgi:hypothetical protein
LPPALALLLAGVAGIAALGLGRQRTTTRVPFGMRS